MRIRTKIIVYIMVPITILFYISIFYILEDQKREKIQELKDKIETTNKLIQFTSVEPLWNYDIDSMRVIVHSFFELKEIVKISVYNTRNTILMEVKKEGIPDREFTLAIEKESYILGKIEIVYTNSYINEAIKKTRQKFLILIGAFWIIVIIMILLIYRIIYRPINIIAEGLQKIDKGNLNFFIKLKRKDEFKAIEEYFNKMILTLKRGREENEKYTKAIIEKNDELEAAYNEMMAINETLTETLRELEMSENQYRNIFNYAPAGMMILDVSTAKIKEFNKEFLNILNLRMLDVINISIFDVFQIKEAQEMLDTLKRGEVIYNKEVMLTIPDKEVIFSAIPVEYNKDDVQVVIKDITELKRLQRELEGYAKSLEEKVKIRTIELEEANEKIRKQQQEMIQDAYNKGLVEVTSGIIHNIGNIVNVIYLNIEEFMESFPKLKMNSKFFKEVVYSELLKIENKTEKMQKIIKAVPQVIEVMDEFDRKLKIDFEFLIKKIVHLKEIIQLQQNFVGGLGTEDYNNVNAMIEEVLELYSSSIEKRKIFIDFEKGDIPLLLSDKSQIIQIITNCIKNSYEAIEESGKENGKIEIKTFVKENQLNISIKDNGIGIKNENKDKIFEFGFSTKKKSGKGSGFGMHSSYMIIKKYSGEIKIESVYGKYTEIKILIPVKKGEDL